MTVRRHQFRPLGASIDKIVKPLLGTRGFGAASVVTQWPQVVGEALARETLPERIAYPMGERSEGTLHLRVANSALALELQHLEPQLIERINGHFGYRAVARIRLIQGPITRTAPQKPKPVDKISPEMAEKLERQVAQVENPELKAALKALGERIGRAR
jgi:hypothetical protein